MSRQAISCAVLLLVVTLPSPAVDTKPAPAANGDSWAPLEPAPAAPDSAMTPRQAAKLKDEERKRTVPLNQAPTGYHDVKLKNGGVVRVSNEATVSGPSHPTDGPYDPSNADFSRTSSYANKNFSTANVALSRSDAADLGKKSYATSSYGSSSAYNDESRPFATAAYRGTKGNDEFTKTYALPNPADYDKSFATKGSDLASKSSNITNTTSPMDPFATPNAMGSKTFFDPAMSNVKRDKYAGNLDVKRLTDLPNRPLSIDEVRELLNHENIPDLNSKPAEASKPLNDPSWEPPLQLPEISNRAAPATPPPDEARDNDLPSPGMMAQPAPPPAKK